LIHQPARGPARIDRTCRIVEGDPGFGQRIDKARIDARIGVRRYRNTQRHGNPEHNHQTSHHPIMAQIGATSVRLLTRRRHGVGRRRLSGVLEVLRAVGAGGDRGELRRPGRIQTGVLPRHDLDNVDLRPTLVHHSAGRLACLDRATFAFDGDARLGERIEEARIKARVGAAGTRLHQCGRAQRGGTDQHRQPRGHRYMVAHLDTFVAPTEPPHRFRRPAKIGQMAERIEVQRTISAPPADIFAVLCDPQGHVAIDASGMLQDADGAAVAAAGDSFVVHMDREALNDFPELGKYDVTVTIREFEQDQLIAWTVLGQIRPQIGHVYGYRLEPEQQSEGTLVTSFYDWSQIDEKWREAGIFPVISESALRASLGILDRTVRRGYPKG
jgi:hypothetical protein